MTQDTEQAAQLDRAARRVRGGYLSAGQRDALATLLVLAGQAEQLPTPVTAAVFNAVQTLTGPVS